MTTSAPASLNILATTGGDSLDPVSPTTSTLGGAFPPRLSRSVSAYSADSDSTTSSMCFGCSSEGLGVAFFLNPSSMASALCRMSRKLTTVDPFWLAMRRASALMRSKSLSLLCSTSRLAVGSLSLTTATIWVSSSAAAGVKLANAGRPAGMPFSSLVGEGKLGLFGLILGPSLRAVLCRSRRALILILVSATWRQARITLRAKKVTSPFSVAVSISCSICRSRAGTTSAGSGGGSSCLALLLEVFSIAYSRSRSTYAWTT